LGRVEGELPFPVSRSWDIFCPAPESPEYRPTWTLVLQKPEFSFDLQILYMLGLLFIARSRCSQSTSLNCSFGHGFFFLLPKYRLATSLLAWNLIGLDTSSQKCMCIASNIIHHKPIRLDDGLPYLRNTPQKVLGSSEGHQCGICFEDFNLRDTDLGTMDTKEPCRHIFCHDCLFKHKVQRIKDNI